jgi:hypothetical protein
MASLACLAPLMDQLRDLISDLETGGSTLMQVRTHENIHCQLHSEIHHHTVIQMHNSEKPDALNAHIF